MKGEVAGAELLPRRVEVEVERVDGIDLGEARVAEAPIDGALDATQLLLIAEAMDDVGGREVLLRRTLEDRGDELRHAGKPEPAELLDQQLEIVARRRSVVVVLLHGGSSVPSPARAGGSPGSRVIGVVERWS